MRVLLLAAVAFVGSVAQAAAVTVEFMSTPSIGSMNYRATGDVAWQPATVNGFHGAFETASTSVDVDIDGLFATHDLTGFSQGAFVTVVGKSATAWWFNYDPYIGDEVNRWLPVSSSLAGVPEPSAAMLGLAAAAGLALIRRV